MSLLLERVQNTLDSVREVGTNLSFADTSFLEDVMCYINNFFVSGLRSFIPSIASGDVETKSSRYSGDQKLASSLKCRIF
jgi:hypothetical protein